MKSGELMMKEISIERIRRGIEKMLALIILRGKLLLAIGDGEEMQNPPQLLGNRRNSDETDG